MLQGRTRISDQDWTGGDRAYRNGFNSRPGTENSTEKTGAKMRNPGQGKESKRESNKPIPGRGKQGEIQVRRRKKKASPDGRNGRVINRRD